MQLYPSRSQDSFSIVRNLLYLILSLVRIYTEIEELSPTILHEFIEKIVVHAPDKSSGKRKQKVEIFYNAIEISDVPGEDEMVCISKGASNGGQPGQRRNKSI